MKASLHNKNILLGVCGGIAAYKSAELLRRLQDTGANVRVVMTSGATKFITPLTFQALSGHPVHTDLLDTEAEAAMGHIELARWADLILIAPATANSIARLASGRADDLLTAIYLASNSKKAVAPAMNHVMWTAETTRENIQKLQKNGTEIFGPASGDQACGETGPGRLLEADKLISSCTQLFDTGELQGIKIMITAGPTYEPIDPVRFIGNRSSGKMGFAIAQAAIEQGAIVSLIAGPVSLNTPEHSKRTDVETALQMHQAVMNNIDGQDIFIATAAVADYRPIKPRSQKIKKTDDEFSISLTPNPDILKEVAALDNPPFTLGFAAETQNVKDYALLKLKNKKLQMIAANQVSHSEDEQDTGFNSEYNALQILWNGGEARLERCRKTQLARQLITLLAKRYHEKTTT
ncbi:MAG: bifunctional phosphopantothenoylcysteine decarboxylase/phosphopantothenate--cysteine ligase CoaBC [endosymbiont of Galathealinum brachiosum]|uniref:Coenzyme A biosynthesis bifunctional protein CoaBC n=1 Tax=endosymbiont of Galathealinum brachiosum TaxID=2200906 RepID=A0A370DCE1_9GAMM|nr:MAG: bifunctional phosphopantothenoylcysteine decarboxylase/phosphopantothenate--cysteine ligase CoaBC [endosymbiont of Galathealinum brachiosum]